MKVLITGGTGNLGQKITSELNQLGHEIVIVSRSEKSVTDKFKFPVQIICKNLTLEPLTAQEFAGVDSVIHLMGESIDGRWTNDKKSKILSSRILSSKNLLKNMPATVKVVISASAQGYYGDQGSKVLNEDSGKGTGFLADVCDQWEQPFRQLKQRNIQLRTGIILDSESGALKKMIPIFKSRLGAGLGSAQQYMSWVSMSDMVRIVLYLLKTESLSGPVNCAAPEPVTNLEFTRSLCQTLKVFQWPNIPAVILKLTLGEMSQIVLASTRLSTKKIIQSGFKFNDIDLQKFLDSELAEKNI